MILVQQCIVVSKKKSAIDIAFRKAPLSLSEQKNEVTKKLFIIFWVLPKFRHSLKAGKRLLKFRKIQYITMAWKDVV